VYALQHRARSVEEQLRALSDGATLARLYYLHAESRRTEPNHFASVGIASRSNTVSPTVRCARVVVTTAMATPRKHFTRQRQLKCPVIDAGEHIMVVSLDTMMCIAACARGIAWRIPKGARLNHRRSTKYSLLPLLWMLFLFLQFHCCIHLWSSTRDNNISVSPVCVVPLSGPAAA
jgi:hypothetical protein